MATLTLTRECLLPPSAALKQLTAWLTSQGYTVVSSSLREATLYYSSGSLVSGRLHETRHQLSVASDGVRVTFSYFDTLGDRDLAVAETRALAERSDEALAHLREAVEHEPRVRCGVCGARNVPAASACAVCGSAL